jgi:hypothetical protein
MDMEQAARAEPHATAAITRQMLLTVMLLTVLRLMVIPPPIEAA